MGKGSGGGNTTSTVTQSNLPSYAKEYFTNLLDDAQTVVDRPYETYQGQRIAGIDPTSMNGINEIGGLQGVNGQMQQGQNLTTQAANGIGGLTTARAANIGSTQFDQSQADKYMSPYIQDVINSQKSGAVTDYQRQAGDRAGQAVQAGALGGTRRGVADHLATEGLNSSLQKIQAEGMQSAYGQAQQQFNADRSSQTDVDKTNVDNWMKSNGMNLDALNALGAAGKQSFDQGLAANDSEIKVAGEKIKSGNYLQDYNQSILDQKYADFVNQRDFQKQQLGWMGGILHGTPVTADSTVKEFSPGSSSAGGVGSILGGLGLAANATTGK